MDDLYYDGRDAETGWDDTVDQLLDQAQQHQRERLEQELERIADQLDRRSEIHDKIVDELEWKRQRYTDRLEELYRQGRGQHDGTRQRLKDRIEEFSQALREERREHWQDRQQLERERRDVLRELDKATNEVLSDFL